MALTNAAAMTFDSPGFDDDVEPLPSTKRFDPRDLQAAARVSAHVEDDDVAASRTLVISPEENARLRAEAFPDSSESVSLRDADVEVFDDVTVEAKAPAVALPAWVFDEPLDEAALSLPGGPASSAETRRSEGVVPMPAPGDRTEPRTAGLLAAAWAVAAMTVAAAGYVFFAGP